MKVITKLAVRSLNSHRGRSAVIGTAIVLTLVLFMTVISITFDIFTSTQLSLMLATGSDAHSMVYTNSTTLTEDELLTIIESRPEVKDAYLLTDRMNRIAGNGISSEVRVCSVSGKGILPHLFMKLVDGNFPETFQEIILNVLDFPDAKPGDTVEMTVDGFPLENADGSFRISEQGTLLTESRTLCYTVSGLYESETDRPAQVAGVVLYDRENLPKTQVTSVMISFRNTLNLLGKHNALVDALTPYAASGEIRANINNAYLSAGEDFFTPANVLLVVFAVWVIFFCAFFLIYNIYSISLTQDMQAYGLLSVVGTTYRQIRAMIRRQTLILYAIFAPVGLVIGYALGWKLIAPIFMSMSGKDMNYRFSPWILAVSAALTLFTLLYSAMRPIRRIRKYSPIETVNGSTGRTPKPVQKTKRITPSVLASRFAARNPRRTAVTALSTVFSILILIFVSSCVGLVKYVGVDEMEVHDIALFTYGERQVMKAGSGQISMQETKLTLGAEHSLIDAALLAKIEAVEGLDFALPIYFAETTVEVPAKLQASAKEILPLIHDTTSGAFPIERLEAIAGGTMEAIFISIPDAWMGDIRIAEGRKYKGDELAAGTHVISLTGTNNIPVKIDEHYQTVFLDETFADGDTVRAQGLEKDYNAIVPAFDRSYKALYNLLGYVSWGNGIQVFVMPQSVFLKEFGDYGIYAILCNAAEKSVGDRLTLTESQQEIRAQIDKIVSEYHTKAKGGRYYVRTSGRFDGLEELRDRLMAIQLTGYSLCAIIFLIGMMNTVNSALSSVIERRQECAMLEAVGMTDRQLMKMMLIENFRTAGLAGCITALVGMPLVTVILRSAVDAAMPISWLSGIVMLAVCIAVSVLSGLAVFRLTKAAPVVERIKVE